MPETVRSSVNDLAPYWMPFTANRQFKRAPLSPPLIIEREEIDRMVGILAAALDRLD